MNISIKSILPFDQLVELEFQCDETTTIVELNSSEVSRLQSILSEASRTFDQAFLEMSTHD